MLNLSPAAETLWQILKDLGIDLTRQDRFSTTEKRTLAMFVGVSDSYIGHILRECKTAARVWYRRYEEDLNEPADPVRLATDLETEEAGNG